MTEKQIKKLRCFIEYYGAGNQLVKAIEEFAELQQVLAKICTIPDSFKENTIKSSVYSEIADVEIMLEQLKIIFDCKKDVEKWVDYKIQRQIERMAKS